VIDGYYKKLTKGGMFGNGFALALVFFLCRYTEQEKTIL